MSQRFVVLVPVKSPGTGKSRLVGVPDRAALAAAFATDLVRACLVTDRVDRVLVTTDDPAFAESLAALGADTTEDPGAGLNAALRAAAADARTRWPMLHPVAVLADIPSLRPTDLAVALTAVDEHHGTACFLADADGTGTVLYAAPAASFAPRFGPGSAQAHRADGCEEITGALPSLRRDVDDPASLAAALDLGVGPATRAALAR
ncbi:2-phospho-L-lactate guanylyltransferase [Nocardioides sambongensis]|uniref:2-phospho-L-lactate guanylyltransferase n=1 Tax=Nocardioides sambongensis TaxID=2589074 RepID=UPI0038B2D24B